MTMPDEVGISVETEARGNIYLMDRRLMHRLPAQVQTLPGPVPEIVRLVGVTDDAILSQVGLSWDRYLDRHRVVYDAESPATRVVAERFLYDAVARTYESQIDRERNVAVIRRLLEQVGPGWLIDYGCGTGISLDALDPALHQLLGVDVSPSMRTIAESRGLITVPVEALETNTGCQFDGAFASYVLHLASAHEHLSGLASSIRVGGRFAANFHKGRGMHAVDQILRSCGFDIEARREPSRSVPAPEIVWVRRSARGITRPS